MRKRKTAAIIPQKNINVIAESPTATSATDVYPRESGGRQVVRKWSRLRANPAGAGDRGYFYSGFRRNKNSAMTVIRAILSQLILSGESRNPFRLRPRNRFRLPPKRITSRRSGVAPPTGTIHPRQSQSPPPMRGRNRPVTDNSNNEVNNHPAIISIQYHAVSSHHQSNFPSRQNRHRAKSPPPESGAQYGS